jgi:hypothetical protein
MAPKKKSKKQSKAKRTAGKKVMPAKKLAKKSASSTRKSVKTKRSQKAVVRTKVAGKRAARAKSVSASAKRRRNQEPDREVFSPPSVRSTVQSGDLQGLSSLEVADSESVEELVEEGNAYEAAAVTGVEGADNADEREVHTREVPEDDVPSEYLEED